MNIHRTAKNKGLEKNNIHHVCDYDQNHNIERQVIWIQSGNQRLNVFRDQGIANANDQGDCCPQKWDGVQSPATTPMATAIPTGMPRRINPTIRVRPTRKHSVNVPRKYLPMASSSLSRTVSDNSK